ncbi:MAG: MFS transporter [Chloroflexota bacterium]
MALSALSQTVLVTEVAGWFRKRIGLATGITISGMGFAGLLIPIVSGLIDAYSWRIALVIIGAVILVVCLPASLVAIRRPEDAPDRLQRRDKPRRRTTTEPIGGYEPDISPRTAVKMKAFWHIAAAFFFHIFVMQAIITHILPYLTSVEITRTIGAFVAGAAPLVSVAGRLTFGWLADKHEVKRILLICFFLVSLGILMLAFVSAQTIWLVVPYSIFFGLGYGGVFTLTATWVASYFGRKRFGSIYGLVAGIPVAASVISPPLAGWFYDNYGHYQGFWFILAALAMVSAITIATAPPTTKPVVSGETRLSTEQALSPK